MTAKQIILDKIGELKMILNETEYIHVFLPESPVRIHAKIEVLESILPQIKEIKLPSDEEVFIASREYEMKITAETATLPHHDFCVGAGWLRDKIKEQLPAPPERKEGEG
jgi:hypothetical protein